MKLATLWTALVATVAHGTPDELHRILHNTTIGTDAPSGTVMHVELYMKHCTWMQHAAAAAVTDTTHSVCANNSSVVYQQLPHK